MLRRLVIPLLLLIVARPAAGYFNLFLGYAEVRKLLGKTILLIPVGLAGRWKEAGGSDVRSAVSPVYCSAAPFDEEIPRNAVII